MHLPEVASMFPHMDIEGVFPLCHISTLSTHKVLVFRVSEHMFGQVGHIPASVVAHTAFVRLLTFSGKENTKSGNVMSKTTQSQSKTKEQFFYHTTVQEHVSHQATFMRGCIAAVRAMINLLIGVQMPNVLLKLHRVKCDEGAKITAKLVISGVAMPLVLEEDCFVRARIITL